VTTYTAHIRADRKLVLVKEAFSWGAFLFGPLWLLAHRAWIAAAIWYAGAWAAGVMRSPMSWPGVIRMRRICGCWTKSRN
jgi:hypothetical protein